MKTFKTVLIVLTLLLSGNVSVAQSKSELKKQQKEREYLATKKMIERGRFIFETTWLITREGERMRTIGEGMQIYDNKIEVNLPFIGESNRGAFSSNAKIEFSSNYTEPKIDSNDKKRKIIFSFQIDDGTENFNFSFTVQANGYTKVKVASNYRSRIEYEGTIKMNERKL